MRALLDSGIIVALQRTDQLALLTSIARVLPLLVVEEVFDELTDPREGRHATGAAEARAAMEGSVHVVSIQLGSAAATLMDGLLRGRKRNAGECASVAWAAQEEHVDVTFVLRDGRFAYTALEELRGRVQGLHGFLRTTVERGAFPAATAGALAAAAAHTPGVELLPPLWWDDWLESPSGSG
jgi:predicted nucleic acid-binding protein